ncbi:MAG: hypothetical protein IPK82_24590 [Polyangiaceae bacterium]|nr:hypothetical protein [Polyangiaceae bacterium]
MNVFFLVFQMTLGIILPLGIQLADRKRMTAEEKTWVWGWASWGSALYNFGPLSLVAWGYVTRSPNYTKGLAIGVGQCAFACLVQGVISELVDRLLSLSPAKLQDARTGFIAAAGAAVLLGILVWMGRSVYELVRRLTGRSKTGSLG